jgi:threonine/homoserine/homoserine lactone efflux protein
VRLAGAQLPLDLFRALRVRLYPHISYITARMEGIAGQFVSLPLVREASFIAGAKYFGYQGIEIWYAPIPIHNYGEATVQFRQIELTGTSLKGIIKSEIIVFPVVFTASLLFSQFLWQLAPIPSARPIPTPRRSGTCRPLTPY